MSEDHQVNTKQDALAHEAQQGQQRAAQDDGNEELAPHGFVQISHQPGGKAFFAAGWRVAGVSSAAVGQAQDP